MNGSVVAFAAVAVGSVAALAGSVELLGTEGVVEVLVGETPPLGFASVVVAGVVFAVVVGVVLVGVVVVVVVVVVVGGGVVWL